MVGFEGPAVRVFDTTGVHVIPHDVPTEPAAFRAWLAPFATASAP